MIFHTTLVAISLSADVPTNYIPRRKKMKRLYAILVVSVMPLIATAAFARSLGGSGNPPISDPPKNFEVDQMYTIQGEVTFPPPIGTVQVNLKITTCKQGTGGCP
jgi:hypothetical protein